MITVEDAIRKPFYEWWMTGIWKQAPEQTSPLPFVVACWSVRHERETARIELRAFKAKVIETLLCTPMSDMKAKLDELIAD